MASSTHFHYAPQPNWSFNRDVNAPHCRPLTWALGNTKYPERMAKSTSTSPTQRLEAILLFCVGLLILGVALFYDPIGTNPDTGVIELTKVQAKCLLGLFGASFIIAAIFLIVKGLRSK